MYVVERVGDDECGLAHDAERDPEAEVSDLRVCELEELEEELLGDDDEELQEHRGEGPDRQPHHRDRYDVLVGQRRDEEYRQRGELGGDVLGQRRLPA